MSLRLEIVSQHRRALGEHGVRTFGQDGGTIGRSLETDWALPDQHRFVSGQHASIDYHSGAYYIVDTSKNGVYVNDSQTPVGRGNPQRLFPGDRIRIGDYEMTVAIDDNDDTREALAELMHVDPVDLRERVEAPDPTGCELIGEEVITGVGIELILEEDAADTLAPMEEFADAVATSTGTGLGVALELDRERKAGRAETDSDDQWHDLPPEIDALPESPAFAPGRPPESSAASPPESMDVLEWSRTAEVPRTKKPAEAVDAVVAFCRGAGLEAPRLSADETQALMLEIGKLSRELVAGVLASLQLRSLQKSRLRQPGTTIQPRENNVLKFSPNAEEALQRLLLEPSDFYLSATQAVRAAFADINEHQRSVVESMHAAMSEYLQQGSGELPPDFIETLAQSYARRSGASPGEMPRNAAQTAEPAPREAPRGEPQPAKPARRETPLKDRKTG